MHGVSTVLRDVSEAFDAAKACYDGAFEAKAFPVSAC